MARSFCCFFCPGRVPASRCCLMHTLFHCCASRTAHPRCTCGRFGAWDTARRQGRALPPAPLAANHCVRERLAAAESIARLAQLQPVGGGECPGHTPGIEPAQSGAHTTSMPQRSEKPAVRASSLISMLAAARPRPNRRPCSARSGSLQLGDFRISGEPISGSEFAARSATPLKKRPLFSGAKDDGRWVPRDKTGARSWAIAQPRSDRRRIHHAASSRSGSSLDKKGGGLGLDTGAAGADSLSPKSGLPIPASPGPGGPRWRRWQGRRWSSVLLRFRVASGSQNRRGGKVGLRSGTTGGFGNRNSGPSSDPHSPPVSAPPPALRSRMRSRWFDQALLPPPPVWVGSPGGWPAPTTSDDRRAVFTIPVESRKSRSGLLTPCHRFPGQQGLDRGWPTWRWTTPRGCGRIARYRKAAGERLPTNRAGEASRLNRCPVRRLGLIWFSGQP